MGERGGARKNQEAKAKRIERLLSELRRREMTFQEVAAFLGVVPKTAKNLVAELKLAGKVEYDGRTTRLPKVQEPTQEAQGAAIFPGLDETINLLPTPAHRAFFRLLLGTVTARYHLAGTIKDGWPSGIMFGPTGAFKTAMGSTVAQIFGRREETIIRPIARETERSLLGRRTGGGKNTSFQPASYLQEPLLCLDECDKTNDDIRKHILLLAQGDSVMELEGVKFVMKATPFLTFNADSIPNWLHKAYIRRGFILDTNKDFDRRVVSKAASEIFDKLPKVSLASVRPLAKSVPNELIAELSKHCERFLTNEGIKLFDARYISKCALGYTGLGRMSLQRAILYVDKDYLTVTSTLGRVKGGHAEYFDRLLAGLPAESLPAVVEPDEPEEEPGYSLDDLCTYWVEGAKMSVKVGMKCGEDEFWKTATSHKTRYPIEKIGRGRTEYRPDKDYILAQVVHVLGFPASLLKKKRHDDTAVQKVFVAGKNEGWHTGREVAWNRLVECCENQGNDSQCCHVWWNLCHGCRQQNKRLSSGKKVVQLQRRGDIWE